MPSFIFLSCRRSRSSSAISSFALSAVVIGSLIMGGCGQTPGESGAHAAALGGLASPAAEPATAPSPAVDRSSADARSNMEVALSESLAGQAGSLQRQTSAGFAGISVVIVTDLTWLNGSGHMAKEFIVDERYLSDPQVRELVDSTNRDLQSENRDLHGSELDAVIAGVRQAISELFDDVELKPLGLGWWEGTAGGAIDNQKLEVLIGDGKLRRISRSIDILGSTGSDTWEFTS